MAGDLDSVHWQKFCDLWRNIWAHWATYGSPPHYRRAAGFMAAGGFMAGRRAWEAGDRAEAEGGEEA